MQNYLVFQPKQRCFKKIVNVGNDNCVYYWKYKGLSDETINFIKASNYGITPYLIYYDFNNIRINFDGGCLKQGQAMIRHGGIVAVYIVYEISKNINANSRKLFMFLLN